MPLDIWADLREKLPQYKAEYERLGNLIAMIEGRQTTSSKERAREAGGESDRPETQTEERATKQTVRRDEFVGLSTAKAISAFLEAMGKGNPQGPKKMAQALVDGGQIADYEKAYANVQSSLKRMNKAGHIRQVRRGEWGLATWYGAAPKKNGSKSRDDEDVSGTSNEVVGVR